MLMLLAGCAIGSPPPFDLDGAALPDARRDAPAARFADATTSDVARGPDVASVDVLRAPTPDAAPSGCAPTVPAGAREDTDALCADGVDNDCNGYVDCADYGCSRTPAVTVCGTGHLDAGAVPDAARSDSGGGTCAPVVTLNEMQTAGAAGAADEWVELFNAAACDASLSGYTLAYVSAAGTTPLVRWTAAADDRIPPHGFFVIAGAGFSGASQGVLAGGSSGTLAASGGGVALVDATGTVVDALGYGTATHGDVRGTAAPAPATGVSIGRAPDGAAITPPNNAADFGVRAAPTPGAANR